MLATRQPQPTACTTVTVITEHTGYRLKQRVREILALLLAQVRQLLQHVGQVNNLT